MSTTQRSTAPGKARRAKAGKPRHSQVQKSKRKAERLDARSKERAQRFQARRKKATTTTTTTVPRIREVKPLRTEGTHSFRDLGITPALANALSAQGIAEPFPIQIATIPDAIAGCDILGRGQTGSGKTLAFSLSLLTNISNKVAKPHKPLALILTPTRELAQQIDQVIRPLARAVGHESVVIAGGMPYPKQITALRKATAIVVATPGRLIDLLNRNEVQLDHLQIAVLDEADQMADMGFLPVVKEILDQSDPKGQRLLFSATLDRGVDALVRTYLKNPKTHSLQSDQASVTTMEHHVLQMHPGDKDDITSQIAARRGKTILFKERQSASTDCL